MCLAVIGKIKNIDKSFANVDFDGILAKVNIELVEAKENDYVIVHAGFAIKKVEETEAKEILQFSKRR